MSHQAWRVMLWVGLWVAIGGLYACYFGIKADMALMRSEIAKANTDAAERASAVDSRLGTEFVTKVAMRRWVLVHFETGSARERTGEMKKQNKAAPISVGAIATEPSVVLWTCDRTKAGWKYRVVARPGVYRPPEWGSPRGRFRPLQRKTKARQA